MLLVCLIVEASCVQAQEFAVLRITIDRAYDDSDLSVEHLRDVLGVIPFRQVAVVPGDTLSSIILREYGFGKENDRDPLPRTYGLVAAAIQQANYLRSEQSLVAGKLLKIPAIPKRALLNRNDTIIRRPASTGMMVMASLAEPGWAVGEITQSNSDARRTSEVEELVVATDVRRLEQRSDVLDKPFVKLLGVPLKLTLAASDLSEAHATWSLTTEEKQALARLKAMTKQRRPTLFVLDSGFPDESEFNKSRAFVEQLVNHLRSREHLPKIKMPSRRFLLPTQSHCQVIKQALAPLISAGGDAVNVVYLPLTNEQFGRDIWEPLLTLHRILEVREESPDYVPTTNELAPFVRVVLDNLPKKMESRRVTTDKALLDAIFDLGDRLGNEDKSFFFLNESWTLEVNSLKVHQPTDTRALVVVATGNDNRRVLAEDSFVDFASQSYPASMVLGVMNLSPQGTPMCGSSLFDLDHLDDTFAVAYSGVVDAECGTSFSAPRVAWFIAAAEATRTKNFKPREWQQHIFKATKATRKNADWTSVLFSFPSYLEELSKH